MALQLLVRLADSSLELLYRQEGELPGSEMAVLVIEIEDYSDEGLEPERLASVLKAFSACYNAVRDSVGTSQSHVVVRWTDSGSNVLFGFEGIATILQEIRTMFGDMFRAVRYWKHDRWERELESAGKNLRFLEDLRASAAKGTISAETAELTQRIVTESMQKLLRNGALAVSIEKDPYPTRREVLEVAREQLLLPPAAQPSDIPE